MQGRRSFKSDQLLTSQWEPVAQGAPFGALCARVPEAHRDPSEWPREEEWATQPPLISSGQLARVGWAVCSDPQACAFRLRQAPKRGNRTLGG